MAEKPLYSADTCDVYFKHLIDLVPSQFYFDHEDQKKLNRDSLKRYLEASKLKNGRGRYLQKSNLSDMAKYDPRAPTTSALQQKLASLADGGEHLPTGGTVHRSHVAKPVGNTSSAKKALKPKLKTIPSQLPQKRDSEELREELRRKIEGKKEQRMKNLSPGEYYDKVQAKRIELKEKTKLRRKENKKSKISTEKQKRKSENKVTSASEQLDNGKGTAQLVYSKFEFAGQKHKGTAGKRIPKSQYKELYAKITKEKEQLEELKKSDSVKAKAMVEKKAWGKALDLTQGVKVKDDPALIKKTMKRVESQKKKSGKEWKQRLGDVRGRQKQKQEKRQQNLDTRKQAKKDKKIKIAKKKGRLID